ncbi:MAG: TetR/AcrR family transcriptional regulator [Acidimicrobiales bacterium]
MTDTESRRGPYRSRHETERLLLEAGLEVISEGTGTGAFDRITAKDVAELAGVSTGAIYGRWESLEDYQHDLLIYRLERRDSRSPIDFMDLFGQLSQHEAHAGELIRVMTAIDFEYQRRHPAWGPILIAWSLRADEVILEALRTRYRKVRDASDELAQAAMEFAGRKMRNGIEQRDLTVAMTALVDGLTLRSHISPGSANANVHWPTGVSDPVNWTLVAVGSDCLIRYFTEPINGVETRGLWEPASK